LPLGRANGIELCPREYFFKDNPFPKPIDSYNRPLLGVHLGGSNYSLSTEKRFGFPSKALPPIVLDKIISALSDKYNVLLFGLASEYGGEAFRLLNNDITICLGNIAQCSAFIGSDSAFKTMSAMLRIPTVVWVGDYRDDHRDERFLDPYVQEGVMAVYRYTDLNEMGQVEAGIQFCLNFLL
jgi:ADP-heptose:LPS heptosyltransferase